MDNEDLKLDIKYKDFNMICRFCLKKDYILITIFLDDIFNNSEDQTTSEIIELCTGIKISPNDKLPKNLCKSCIEELKNCSKFRRKCHQSEEILQNLLHAHEIKFDDNTTNESSRLNINLENKMKNPIVTKNHRKSKIESKEKNKKNRYKSTPRQCQICGIISYNLYGHMQRIHSDRFKCELCTKTYPTLKGYERHLGSHRTEYKCDQCEKSYAHKTHLKTHIFEKHTKGSFYKCEICEKKFNVYKTYTNHRRTHDESRLTEHECKVCNKAFSSKFRLRNHSYLHTGERPLKCDFCNKGFIRNENLKNHRRVHTDERPYNCNYCELKFRQKGSLNLHVKRNHSTEISDCTITATSIE